MRERFHFIRTIQRLFARQGCDTLRVRLPGTDLFVSSDPALCGAIVADRAGPYAKTRAEHRVLEPAMHDGLILLEGDAWKARRRASAACMGPKAITQLTAILGEVTVARISRWGEYIELGHELRCIINESMLRFFLDGSSIERDSPVGLDEFSRSFRRVEMGLETRVFDVFFVRERVRSFLRPAKSFDRSLSVVTRFIERGVARATAATPGPAEEDSVLKGLLRRIPSHASVTHEIRTLLGAGVTTTHLLSWIACLLAVSPEKQSRLREEILSAFGPEGRIDLPRIEQLGYLTAVIQEGLRLYPPAPYLVRSAPAPDAGARAQVFLFSVWAMHRSPKLWRDPDRFVPERWLEPEGPEKRAREEAFVPFGLGPRVCIGKRFAMTEARVILAEVLRRFRIELEPGAGVPEAVFTVLTRPASGVVIRPVSAA